MAACLVWTPSRRPVFLLTWLTAAQTFDVMLDRGEIDTAYGFAPRHDPKLMTLNIDRYGGTPLEGNPRIGKMFADGGCPSSKLFTRRPASSRPTTSSSRSAACSNKIPGWRRGLASSSARANGSPTSTKISAPRHIFISKRSREPREDGRQRSISIRHKGQSQDAGNAFSQLARQKA